MNNLNIRNIEEKDIPNVVQIRVDGWRTAYRGIINDDYLDSLNIDERIEKRKKDYKNTGFIVAESNNQIVGFCRYIDSNRFTPNISGVDCELLAIYIKPEFKRHGIGASLFRYVRDEFKSKQKRKMILWCLKDNIPSKKFYVKMGGEAVAEKETYIGGKKYLETGFLFNLC